MMHIRICSCQLKDLDNIYVLSQAIAHYFPKPEQFITGIYELLLNAFEHGNLGIGFETKSELVRHGKWKEEIARRLALPEHSEKAVEIDLTYDEKECRLVIADQGEGFPWQKYLNGNIDNGQSNGRGLWIALNSKFDQVKFNSVGNEVTCVVQCEHWSTNKRTKR